MKFESFLSEGKKALRALFRSLPIFFTCIQLNYVGFTQMIAPPKNVPSPQAFEFTKYGALEPNLFNGLPNIEIPLNSIDLGGYVLSASLSYDASGFRPDMHPGLVGMNWNLNLGGVLTRKVRGLPDEFRFKIQRTMMGYTTLFNFNNGFLYNTHGFDYDFENYMQSQSSYYSTDCGGPAFPSGHTLPYFIDNGYYLSPQFQGIIAGSDNGVGCVEGDWWPGNISNVAITEFGDAWNRSGMKDAQPDEFTFNALGISGTFYFLLKPPYSSSTNWDNVFSIQANKKVRIIPILNAAGTEPNLFKLPFNPPINGDQATTTARYHNYSPWNRMGEYPVTLTGFKIISDDGTTLTFGKYIPEGSSNSTIFSSLPIEYSMSMYAGNDFWTADSWYLSQVNFPNGQEIKFLYQRGEFVASKYISQATLTLQAANYLPCTSDPYNGCKTGRVISPVYLDQVYSNSFSWSFSRGNSVQLPLNIDFNNIDNFFSSYNPIYSNFTNKWYQLNSILFEDYGEKKYVDLNYSNDPTKRLILNQVDFRSSNKINGKYKFEYNTSSSVGYTAQQNDHWGFWNGVTEPVNTNNLSSYGSLRTPSLFHTSAGIINKIFYPTGGYSEYIYELNSHSSYVDPMNTSLINSTGLSGGLRIKEIKNYDLHSNLSTSKRYYYVKNFSPSNANSGISSGILSYPIKYYWEASNYPTKTLNLSPGIWTTGSLGTIRYFSNQPIYFNTEGYHIGYSEVSVLNLDNSFVVNKYTNHDNGYHDEVETNIVSTSFSPLSKKSSRHFERGKILQELYYNSSSNLLKKVENSYLRKLHPNSLKNSLPLWEAVFIDNRQIGSNGFAPIQQLEQFRFSILGSNYKFFTYSFLKSSEIVTDYTLSGSITSRFDYVYGNIEHDYPTEQIFESNNSLLKNKLRYINDFEQNDFIKSIFSFQNIKNVLIEKISMRKASNDVEFKVLNAELYEYCLNPNGSSQRPVLKGKYVTSFQEEVLYSDFTLSEILTIDLTNGSYPKDSRYRQDFFISQYDINSRPTIFNMSNGNRRKIQYGPYKDDILFDIISNDKFDLTYVGAESFEKFSFYDFYGIEINDVFNSNIWESYSYKVSPEGFSGNFALNDIIKSVVTFPHTEFHLWAKANLPKPILNQVDENGVISSQLNSSNCVLTLNGWCLYKYYLTNPSKVSINPNGNLVDEVRYFKLGDVNGFGNLQSYTYLNGKLSQIIFNENLINYFEYDKSGRLSLIRDSNGKILKKFCYSIQGQSETCVLFENQLASQIFQKNNCQSGLTGNQVLYSVPAGTYSAFSQAEADQLALNDIAANGQAYANANGTCSQLFFSAAISDYFANGSCGAPEPYYVTIPYGQFTSSISQADADNKAYLEAQRLANQYGVCLNITPLYGSNSSTYQDYIIQLSDVNSNAVYYFYLDPSTTDFYMGEIPWGYYNVSITPIYEVHSYSTTFGCDYIYNNRSGTINVFTPVPINDVCNLFLFY